TIKALRDCQRGASIITAFLPLTPSIPYEHSFNPIGNQGDASMKAIASAGAILGLALLLGVPAHAQKKAADPSAKKSETKADAKKKKEKKSMAVIHTSMGKIEIKLFPEKAPKTVENFVGLATGEKEWTDPKSGEKKKGTPLY